MSTAVRLLGRPRVVCDGRPALAPRGNKGGPAGLPAAERASTDAQELVSLLFPEAVDPLRTLRWNLTELRRTLRGVASIDGDPLVLTPVLGCDVDVRLLTDGSPAQALALDCFGQELLEGLGWP